MLFMFQTMFRKFAKDCKRTRGFYKCCYTG
jgi:hypothetical protein